MKENWKFYVQKCNSRNLFDLINFKNYFFFILTFLNILRIKNILLKTLNYKKMNSVNGNNNNGQSAQRGVFFFYFFFFREYMLLIIMQLVQFLELMNLI